MRLTIGSRGSKLALTQTHLIADLLRQHHTDLQVEIEIISTQGDTTGGPLHAFGGQGVFTGALETALVENRIDLAVHSLKDLPTAYHPELVLAATPPREDVRDVLLTTGAKTLAELPPQARLGTGSLRRRAQLLALRSDLEPVEIRGNIDTRIAKLQSGDFDAIVLAAAGLNRLGRQQEISVYLDPNQVLPAVGQAALGLQMRRNHPHMTLVAALNHPPTFAAVSAERTFLAQLEGGCHAPIAAWGQVEGQTLSLEGLVGRPDGSLILRHSLTGNLDQPEALGDQLATALKDQGADQLLATPS